MLPIVLQDLSFVNYVEGIACLSRNLLCETIAHVSRYRQHIILILYNFLLGLDINICCRSRKQVEAQLAQFLLQTSVSNFDLRKRKNCLGRSVSQSSISDGDQIQFPFANFLAGIRTVDIGVPQLSMHSIRETCGVDDLYTNYKLLEAFFSEGIEIDQSISVEQEYCWILRLHSNMLFDLPSISVICQSKAGELIQQLL